MCGRYTFEGHEPALQEAFPFVEAPAPLEPRYNIAPTQNVPVIANDQPDRVRLFRWGLIPHFAEDPAVGNRLINARAETVAEKPSFRAPFARRRCLVLADGFYEWRKDPGGRTKTPFYIRMADGRPFAFAGLWDVWRPRGAGPAPGTPPGSPESAEPVRSFTIITTASNELVAPLHDRMPVILRPQDHELWLDREEKRPAELQPLLVPFDAGAMTAYPVSKLVNSPKNDLPECIRPAAG